MAVFRIPNALRPASLRLAGLLALPLAIIGCSGDDEAADRPVYVALGASDAVGIGAARPAEEGWVPLVHDGLAGETRLLNLGISGATADEIIASELPVLADVDPTLITLWPGVNDLRSGVPLDAFRARLNEILATLNEREATTIIVLNIPDLRYLPVFSSANPDTLDATVRDWNIAIAEVSDRHGAMLVDLYGSSLELDDHPEYISADGFHPSSTGYRRIADLVLSAIETNAPALR